MAFRLLLGFRRRSRLEVLEMLEVPMQGIYGLFQGWLGVGNLGGRKFGRKHGCIVFVVTHGVLWCRVFCGCRQSTEAKPAIVFANCREDLCQHSATLHVCAHQDVRRGKGLGL